MTPTTIRALRLARGWTQAQLAAALGGYGVTTIRAWEHGRNQPGPAARKLLQELAATPPPVPK